jgi:phosphatidylglycerol:prolipoprotein diacylglycerol transferase
MKGPQLYAVFQVLALLAAFFLRKASTLPWRKQLAVLAGALAGAGIGAKLPFVILGHEPFFSGSAWFTEGKTILSGLAGGYLGVELAKVLAGVREKQGDAFAVPLAAAIAIGRWGCFFNGCCGAPLVPPIESAFHASMAILLWRLGRIEALRWQLLKLYLIAYSVFRFFIEFVRTEPRVALGLTPYQYGSAAMAILLGLLWWHDERVKRGLSASPSAGTLQK